MDPIVKTGNNNIKCIHNTQSLGVIIDKLDWKVHILSISKKVSKGIEMLRYCKSFVSKEILKMIYSATILDYCIMIMIIIIIIDYYIIALWHFHDCSLVWSNYCSETLKLNLQKFHNSAARGHYK